ncbi:PPE family protein [Mycobacterium bourgelatii]|uniref:PPE family protein n=1 Tax=Mycobacterium bourgelatii TaxID=1273442 RepID=A0A7I9YQU8_MYCBU|nr:PPE family protein [Mycobacterium bourgelatii]MCV6975104.1 PPE family protein [Mycobacterium bourgelatii]GFG91018.1 PPE family protein [Mycobacterium bourgelatii]
MVVAPPEVITGRLMSGAGAGPMLAASASFGAAAAAYEAASDRLEAHLAWLMNAWQSPAALALLGAVTRFIVWLRVVEAQLIASAARTADQAAAFTTAYATMAQMAEIVENRVTTAVLIGTNFLGINTIPIGIREGQYLEMTIQDITVQETYLAASMANTTFEAFVPAVPIVVGMPVLPPVIEQAVVAAERAGDTLMLAAAKAESTAQLMAQTFGQGVSAGTTAGLWAKGALQQADPRDALDRYRDAEARQQNLAEKFGKQLVQQAPQQVAQGVSQAAQIPGQAMQFVTQPVQQVQQFGSQIGNLLSQVKPEHRVENPGFFDTQPSSPTLDRLAGSNVGPAAMTAAVRVPNLGGLSAASTGFRFPSGWDGAPPPAPPVEAPATGRPSASGMTPLSALQHRRDDEEDTHVTRPTPELVPVWSTEPPELQTVSAGELVEQRQEAI